MRKLCIFLITFCLNVPTLKGSEVALEQGFNNGENILQPITRFDTRLACQTDANGAGNLGILTLRMDKVLNLSAGWQLSFRGDLPYDWFVCTHHAKDCHKLDHFGDTLLQMLVIAPPIEKWTWGFGLQGIIPTGGNNLNIGDAKYELHPTIGIAYDLKDWREGAYIGLLIRHAFSVAGYKSAPRISQTYIQPFFNINLPEQWFINSSPELRYNWVTDAWFIPLDLMIGKMVTKKLVVSLEYDYAVFKKFTRYAQQLEFRVGYFF